MNLEALEHDQLVAMLKAAESENAELRRLVNEAAAYIPAGHERGQRTCSHLDHVSYECNCDKKGREKWLAAAAPYMEGGG